MQVKEKVYYPEKIKEPKIQQKKELHLPVLGLEINFKKYSPL